MNRHHRSVATRLAMAVLLLLAGLACPVAAPAQPATQYRPEKIREAMLSIHGYTRAGLEAASTNVDEILMLLAEDPQEDEFIRRQAIKGLRLYPTGGVLAFIEQNSAAAPADLKRLYLRSAAPMAQAFPDRVRALAETSLNDQELHVRFAALKLANALQATPPVRAMLQSRLAREPDRTLRAAIQKKLNAN